MIVIALSLVIDSALIFSVPFRFEVVQSIEKQHTLLSENDEQILPHLSHFSDVYCQLAPQCPCVSKSRCSKAVFKKPFFLTSPFLLIPHLFDAASTRCSFIPISFQSKILLIHFYLTHYLTASSFSRATTSPSLPLP